MGEHLSPQQQRRPRRTATPSAPASTAGRSPGLQRYLGNLALGNLLNLRLGAFTETLPGTQIPIPASLQVISGLGRPFGMPFMLNLSPQLISLHLLNSLVLQSSTRPGTPIEAAHEPQNQAQIRLEDPSLLWHPSTGRLNAFGTLAVDSTYPAGLVDPLEIDVAIASNQIGVFSGTARTLGGALTSDFNLRLHYKADRLAERVRSAFTPEGGPGEVATEITHPGFTLGGTVRLAGLPIAGFSATAPTTVPLDNPIIGAPAAFPIRLTSGGIIIAPAGTVSDISVPALGYNYSNFDAEAGTSFTSALLPKLSLEAISEGRPALEQFPVFAFAEFTHARRITDDVDIGVRLTVQISSPEVRDIFFGAPAEPQAQGVNYDALLQTYGSATKPTVPAVPNIGGVLYGTF